MELHHQAEAAVKIAAVIVRRRLSATPYAEKDSGIGLAKAISRRARLAYDEIGLLLPGLLEKYKDQPPKWETRASETGELVRELVPTASQSPIAII